MRRIGSKNHDLSTYVTNKRSLSCFDGKRYIFKNGINTLAYGHKDIKNETVLLTKITKNTMKNGHIYLIIRTEFW